MWSTDKDGIILALLASEILAVTGKTPSQLHEEQVERFGASAYARIDAAASREEKAKLAALSADDVTATELAGDPIVAKLVRAPGNDAPIGGLKVTTESAWFAARPSGTEDVYKIYAESFKGAEHLAQVQEAAKKVKAVLSGEGADEFFGGYRIYQTPFANAKLSWVPKGLLRGASKAAHALGVRGANYLERASETPEDWYYTNANGVAFSPEERARLLKRPVQACSPQELIAPAYAEVSDLDETTRMQYVDLFFWLVGDILLKTDKMSMAHSLESRVPFLDKEVFNVSRTIPTPFKANGEQTKIALREAAERAIPKDWAQKEKLGFPVPMVDWLRQDRYYNQVKEWFTGDIAQQFFNTDELVRLLDEHRYKIDRSRKIWIVYMFLMWYKIYFVDKTVPKKPAA